MKELFSSTWDYVPEGTFSALEKQWLQGEPELFHYAGHATANGILLRGQDERERVGLKELQNLVLRYAPTCVFLNGCYTWGLVRQLEGVAVRIGWDHRVDNAHAQAYARDFYSALWAKKNYSDALAAAHVKADVERRPHPRVHQAPK